MSEGTPTASARVLVADDDPSVLALLALALRKAGHEVVTAKDGAEAIAAIESGRYNLLVLDVLMPGATGWEVLARAFETTPAGIPLPRALLVTGFHQEYVVDLRLLREEGVSAMLLKPFGAADFLEEVERVLALEPRFSLPRRTETAGA